MKLSLRTKGDTEANSFSSNTIARSVRNAITNTGSFFQGIFSRRNSTSPIENPSTAMTINSQQAQPQAQEIESARLLPQEWLDQVHLHTTQLSPSLPPPPSADVPQPQYVPYTGGPNYPQVSPLQTQRIEGESVPDAQHALDGANTPTLAPQPQYYAPYTGGPNYPQVSPLQTQRIERESDPDAQPLSRTPISGFQIDAAAENIFSQTQSQQQTEKSDHRMDIERSVRVMLSVMQIEDQMQKINNEDHLYAASTPSEIPQARWGKEIDESLTGPPTDDLEKPALSSKKGRSR